MLAMVMCALPIADCEIVTKTVSIRNFYLQNVGHCHEPQRHLQDDQKIVDLSQIIFILSNNEAYGNTHTHTHTHTNTHTLTHTHGHTDTRTDKPTLTIGGNAARRVVA